MLHECECQAMQDSEVVAHLKIYLRMIVAVTEINDQVQWSTFTDACARSLPTLSANSSRLCGADGLWEERTHYDNCQPLPLGAEEHYNITGNKYIHMQFF